MLKKAIVLAVLGILLIGTAVYASFEWQFPITVTDTSNTAHTYYAIDLGFGTDALVAAGKLDANGLDSNMQEGATNLAFMNATSRVMAVLPSLPALESRTIDYYTGYAPVQTSVEIVPGEHGYVTTPDNATLEPSDSVRLDILAGLYASGTLLDKHDSLKIAYNATTQVLTAQIGNDGAPDITLTGAGVTNGSHTITLLTSIGAGGAPVTDTVRPTSDGDEHAPQANPGVGQWIGMSQYRTYANADYAFVDEVAQDGFGFPGQQDVTPTWLYDFYANGYTCLFKGDALNTTTVVGISSVKIYIYAQTTSATGSPTIYPTVKIGGTKYTTAVSPDHHNLEADRLYDSEWILNPATGTTWTATDINNMSWGATLSSQSLGWGEVTQAYMTVTYSGAPTLDLYVDDVLQDSDYLTTPIPDNANSWVWTPLPYIDYIKLRTSN